MKTIFVLLLGGCLLLGQTVQLVADEREKAVAAKRQPVATVLDKPIYLDQITPNEAAEKRKSLSKSDYQKWLRKYRADWLLSSITGQVLKEYAVREKLSPTDEEIDALIAAAVQKYSDKIKQDQESQKKLAIERFWLQASSREWRTAKSLYQKHGGRVAVSSFGGCVSFEGRNAVLKEFYDRGEIKFNDTDLEQAFWEKSKDERILDVTLQPQNVPRHFAVAPWERWIQELAQREAEPAKLPAKKDDNK